jgi:hypothetical protein
LPFILWTVSVEKTGSMSLSNQMRTTEGEPVTVEPTLGSEWSGKACPVDIPGKRDKKAATNTAATVVRFMSAVSFSMKYRCPYTGWEEVIDVQMDQPQYSDTSAGL